MRIRAISLFLIFSLLSAFEVPALQSNEHFFLTVSLARPASVGSTGDLRYVRVYGDGTVEYEVETATQSASRKLKRYKLTAAQLRSLKEFLARAEIKDLETEYLPPDGSREFKATLVIVSALSGPAGSSMPKVVTVVNFSPDAPGAVKAYPSALIKLLCRIEQLRTDDSVRIMAQPEKRCAN
jgi:hypothetical protein